MRPYYLMGKDKARRFAENDTFENMLQPTFEEYFGVSHPRKGHWAEWFGNSNPLVLELGCGRGEYTIGLAEMYPARNFVGVDIKGARMWRGAKTATEKGMHNAGFLRARIEFIDSFFAANEVSELWITFPDPQLKKGREAKRLTSPQFLARYAKFLKPDGAINLKTDSRFLHDYTKKVAQLNELPVDICSADIYGEGLSIPELAIKTAYETRFLSEGLPITYLRFTLSGKHNFKELPKEENVSE